jgi:hypothetical protein
LSSARTLTVVAYFIGWRSSAQRTFEYSNSLFRSITCTEVRRSSCTGVYRRHPVETRPHPPLQLLSTLYPPFYQLMPRKNLIRVVPRKSAVSLVIDAGRVRKLHSSCPRLIPRLTWNAPAAIVGFSMNGSQNIAITTMAMCTTTRTCTSMRHSGESAV